MAGREAICCDHLNLAYSQVYASINPNCSCPAGVTWRRQIGLLWERLCRSGASVFCSCLRTTPWCPHSVRAVSASSQHFACQQTLLTFTTESTTASTIHTRIFFCVSFHAFTGSESYLARTIVWIISFTDFFSVLYTLLAVPNVTAQPSTASVPITVLLLLRGFNVAIKGLIVLVTVLWLTANAYISHYV